MPILKRRSATRKKANTERAQTGVLSPSQAIQVRERGVVTLPKRLRERYGLDVGDVLDVLDLDGVFVLSPRASVVPELAAEIERLRIEAGYTTVQLLESLRAVRERSTTERFGADVVRSLGGADT